MNKKTLAFFDHAPHKVTKSTYFLRDVLKKKYEVTDLWDDIWDVNSKETIAEINKYDYVLFFQELPQMRELRKVTAKIVWVPMYDAVVWWPFTKWVMLSTVPMKVISFSSTLATKLKKLNFDVLSVQFFVNPNDYPKLIPQNKINIFYWQRRKVNLVKVLNKFKTEDIGEVWLKLWPDKGVSKMTVTEELKSKYNIKIWEANFGKDREPGYFEMLAKCNVFVAPRKYEGIGWSIIEGMAMGMALVSDNFPVASEYVLDGVDGILLANNIRRYGLSDIENMGAAMKRKYYSGFKKWQEDQNDINEFISVAVDKKQNLVKYEEVSWFKMVHYIYSVIASIRFKYKTC